jgi:hypothetical protein
VVPLIERHHHVGLIRLNRPRLVSGVAHGAGTGSRTVSGLIAQPMAAFRLTWQGIDAALDCGSGPLARVPSGGCSNVRFIRWRDPDWGRRSNLGWRRCDSSSLQIFKHRLQDTVALVGQCELPDLRNEIGLPWIDVAGLGLTMAGKGQQPILINSEALRYLARHLR